MLRDTSRITDQQIDARIVEYFRQEENLHWLRGQILNLDGYRRQSDVDVELENMKKQHMDEVAREKESHIKKLHQEQEKFKNYQTAVEQQLNKAAEAKGELASWRNGYGEIADVYAIFSALSLKHKTAIAGIFGGCDSPLDFLCGAMQKGHLEQLWDYISDELGTENIEENEAVLLNALFDFSFNAVNRSQREPLFRRVLVKIGAAFDGDVMGRTTKSPQLGRVKRILLKGFAHEVTGNVIRRSLVELE